MAARFVAELLEESENSQQIVKNVGSGNPVSLRSFCEHWWKRWKALGVIKFGAIRKFL